MAPNAREDFEIEEPESLEKLVAPQAKPGWKKELIPSMIITLTYIHLAGIYGILMIPKAQWATLLFMYVYFVCGVMGLSAGVHRLWSHKSYKAKTPLQIFLMLCHSAINQFSIAWWVQIHRQHHRYSDTDGDPMNSTRGLFFSHIGWLFAKRHPDYVQRKKFIDLTDIKSNPLLMFQKRHVFKLIIMMAVLIPTVLPLLWGESFFVAWHLNMLRLTISYNVTFILNSLAHTWGSKPFDKKRMASQTNYVFFITFGDGYHNYHHTFPWDYSSGEWGRALDFTTYFIDAFAKIGWVYDRKTVSREMAIARGLRTGDGSYSDKFDT